MECRADKVEFNLSSSCRPPPVAPKLWKDIPNRATDMSPVRQPVISSVISPHPTKQGYPAAGSDLLMCVVGGPAPWANISQTFSASARMPRSSQGSITAGTDDPQQAQRATALSEYFPGSDPARLCRPLRDWLAGNGESDITGSLGYGHSVFKPSRFLQALALALSDDPCDADYDSKLVVSTKSVVPKAQGAGSRPHAVPMGSLFPSIAKKGRESAAAKPQRGRVSFRRRRCKKKSRWKADESLADGASTQPAVTVTPAAPNAVRRQSDRAVSDSRREHVAHSQHDPDPPACDAVIGEPAQTNPAARGVLQHACVKTEDTTVLAQPSESRLSLLRTCYPAIRSGNPRGSQRSTSCIEGPFSKERPFRARRATYPTTALPTPRDVISRVSSASSVQHIAVSHEEEDSGDDRAPVVVHVFQDGFSAAIRDEPPCDRNSWMALGFQQDPLVCAQDQDFPQNVVFNSNRIPCSLAYTAPRIKGLCARYVARTLRQQGKASSGSEPAPAHTDPRKTEEYLRSKEYELQKRVKRLRQNKLKDFRHSSVARLSQASDSRRVLPNLPRRIKRPNASRRDTSTASQAAKDYRKADTIAPTPHAGRLVHGSNSSSRCGSSRSSVNESGLTQPFPASTASAAYPSDSCASCAPGDQRGAFVSLVRSSILDGQAQNGLGRAARLQHLPPSGVRERGARGGQLSLCHPTKDEGPNPSSAQPWSRNTRSDSCAPGTVVRRILSFKMLARIVVCATRVRLQGALTRFVDATGLRGIDLVTMKAVMGKLTLLQGRAREFLRRHLEACQHVERKLHDVETTMILTALQAHPAESQRLWQHSKRELLINRFRIDSSLKQRWTRSLVREGRKTHVEEWTLYAEKMKEFSESCREWRLLCRWLGYEKRAWWPAQPQAPPIPASRMADVSADKLEAMLSLGLYKRRTFREIVDALQAREHELSLRQEARSTLYSARDERYRHLFSGVSFKMLQTLWGCDGRSEAKITTFLRLFTPSRQEISRSRIGFVYYRPLDELTLDEADDERGLYPISHAVQDCEMRQYDFLHACFRKRN
ncbi:hypothetical protein BESB_079620 [Besnoitia besnoiti]|uniref:Uncharacterized protein n=1 Tax=Besnoitia besnoiti TaxID=94643 RepID=A0A2A9MCT1_BESBE|nr:hypothetical protein BESB_079620 [Besnoitia besnoiti]PFH33746.1 hypothetical protein BESB_079620 [Besnoitia besnoiti]